MNMNNTNKTCRKEALSQSRRNTFVFLVQLAHPGRSTNILSPLANTDHDGKDVHIESALMVHFTSIALQFNVC